MSSGPSLFLLPPVLLQHWSEAHLHLSSQTWNGDHRDELSANIISHNKIIRTTVVVAR